MATDYQLKKDHFETLVEKIRVGNIEFWRGKTLSRVFIIGKSANDEPALLFPKRDVPEDIKDQLNNAFKTVFLDAE